MSLSLIETKSGDESAAASEAVAYNQERIATTAKRRSFIIVAWENDFALNAVTSSCELPLRQGQQMSCADRLQVWFPSRRKVIDCDRNIFLCKKEPKPEANSLQQKGDHLDGIGLEFV